MTEAFLSKYSKHGRFIFTDVARETTMDLVQESWASRFHIFVDFSKVFVKNCDFHKSFGKSSNFSKMFWKSSRLTLSLCIDSPKLFGESTWVKLSGQRSSVWRMASHLCSSQVSACIVMIDKITNFKLFTILLLSIPRKEVVTKQTEGYSQQQQEEEEEILVFQVWGVNWRNTTNIITIIIIIKYITSIVMAIIIVVIITIIIIIFRLEPLSLLLVWSWQLLTKWLSLSEFFSSSKSSL